MNRKLINVMGMIGAIIFGIGIGISVNSGPQNNQLGISVSDTVGNGNEYIAANNQIYKNGQVIQLKGANWFGMETETYVFHGLWSRNWEDMIDQMVDEAELNALRVPVCPYAIRENSQINSSIYANNPDLRGLTAMEAFDKILNRFEEKGIYFIIDVHRIDPACSFISELWYSDTYSEEQWIDDLRFLADRYRDNSYFVGLDLKNEPHGAATWGTGNTATDWNTAAEKAGAAVLQTNSNLLIFVEGVGDNPVCQTNEGHFWGGNFEPWKCAPIDHDKIPKNKLVLSPHVYGPGVAGQTYFNAGDFPNNMSPIWDRHFGFLIEEGYTIVPGEWGGKYGVDDRFGPSHPQEKTWMDAFAAYMVDKEICSSFFWSWNENSGDTGGLLVGQDWQNIDSTKLNFLQNYWNNCEISAPGNNEDTNDNPDEQTNGSEDTEESNSGDETIPDDMDDEPVIDDNDTPDNSDSIFEVEFIKVNEWNSGYTAEVIVKNISDSPIVGWELKWNFTEGETITGSPWNTSATQSGSQVIAKNVGYNETIQPGSQISFGFNVNKNGSSTSNLDTCDFNLNNLSCDDNEDTSDNTDDSDITTPVVSCNVKFEVNSRWNTGFVGRMTITNTGSEALESWELNWNFTNGESIRNLWNAEFTQNDQKITASNLGYNARINPNQSRSFGFVGRHNGGEIQISQPSVNELNCNLI